MELIVGALRALFDGILLPFRGMPALVGLAVVSLLTAIGMLLVFKATSNQKKIGEVKRRIYAGLFEIRLFNDDARAIFRAQAEILINNLKYVGLSLVPMLWMIVPILLVLTQLQFHYGYRGLEPGQKTVFKVVMKKEKAPQTALAREKGPSVTLELPEGLKLETPGVWIPSKAEIAWRLAAVDPGDYIVNVKLEGEEPVAKRVHVGDSIVRRSPSRLEAGFKNQLFYPAEPPLPKSSSLAGVYVDYDDAEVSLFGWKTLWMVVFFILSIVFGFALKGAFKVDL
jgi:uncharacterized membrane protein (DUF106 family)